jgi:uncharacterized protein (TIGR03435 family)
MLRGWTGALVLCAVSAGAQQTFEVASVKPSAPDASANPMLAKTMERMYDSQPRGWIPAEKGRLNLKNRSLRGLIASAYRVRSSEVSGPAWMADARFDIEAKFPVGTPKEALNEMLRALLEERFGLAVHREPGEVAGYAIVQAKGGAKLTAAAPEEKPAEAAPMDEEARREQQRKMQEQMQKRMQEMRKQTASGEGPVNRNSWNAPSVTLGQLGDWLAPLLEKPVVDATGLEGKYAIQIVLERYGDDTQEYAANQALAKLGLKLEARKVPVSTVVVDKVERTPREN